MVPHRDVQIGALNVTDRLLDLFFNGDPFLCPIADVPGIERPIHIPLMPLIGPGSRTAYPSRPITGERLRSGAIDHFVYFLESN